MAMQWGIILWMSRTAWLALAGWLATCLIVADDIAGGLRSGEIGAFHHFGLIEFPTILRKLLLHEEQAFKMDKHVSLFGLANLVLGKVCSYAADQVVLASNVKRELVKLKNSLSDIGCVLQDAEKKQATDSMIREWLKVLKNVICDLDDLLDDVSTAYPERWINEVGGAKQVSYRVFPSAPILYFMLSTKLKHVRKRIDKLAAFKRNFQLIEGQTDVIVAEDNHKRVYGYGKKPNLVGREVDRRRILECLLEANPSKDLSIVPIVGSGGLGKTTLAKLVYDDEWVVQNYDVRLWVCFSDMIDLRKMVEVIVESATGISMHYLEMEKLHRKLFNLFYAKRYLLVLDDFGAEHVEEWTELKKMLSVGKPGSVVLVTTQNSSVSLTGVPYNLGKLSIEKCWLIFKQYAFKEGEEKQHPVLVETGLSIAKKCGGLPLAAKILGSTLRGVRGKKDWRQFGKIDSDIAATLRLCCDVLPTNLKMCFTYCAIFGKGQKLYRELVISHWMAHGLVQFNSEEGDSELEAIGDKIFSALLSKSFFQDEDMIYSDNLVSCGIHDLVYDLARDSTREEQIVMKCDAPEKGSASIRHISWDKEDLSCKKFPQNLRKAKRVRTFLFNHHMGYISKSFLEGLISAFKCLRVLDLHNSDFDHLPSSVGELSHLRLLNLSKNRMIKSLPNSISKLSNLQTFYILACGRLEELPAKGMKNLTRLRHVHVTLSKQAHFLPKKGLHALTSLRTLQLYKCTELRTLSEGIRHLTALKTLLIYGCPVLSSLPNGIKSLTRLEKLAIRNCRRLDLLLGGGLSGLQSLESLELGGCPSLTILPDGIRSASDSLKYLYIEDCEGLTRLPGCFQDFSRLLKVLIHDCPKFSVLPKGLSGLKTLSIKGCPYLRARLARNVGNDWPLISHIPEIGLDH